MGRRKNNAIRKEQEQMASQAKYFYQNHEKTLDANTITFRQPKQRKAINLVPKTSNQGKYIRALENPEIDVVVSTGPAGTGKTYLAVLAAIKALRSKEIERLVLTRPAVGVDDEQHGFLPGDLNAKMEPWTRPLLDVLREYYSIKEIEYMVKEQIIEIAPLAFMRGRTFKYSWVILDESQNCTSLQMKMLLTRIGEGTKIIITGDIEQSDRKKTENGLMDLENRLLRYSIPGLELCKFDLEDVQRHHMINQIIKLYNS